jgi:GNAT superfamily N-acetyltransferase
VTYIRPLAAEHADRIAGFDCGDDDLRGFLRDDAHRLQLGHVVRTYVALDDEADDQLVGYVSMMADAVVLETKERKGLLLLSSDHPVVPAVKVARLAVSTTRKRQGLGRFLMHFAVSKAYDAASVVGCRVLTVDAYPSSISFYEHLGFVRNRAKPYKRKEHPSMRLDLFASLLPAWLATPE